MRFFISFSLSNSSVLTDLAKPSWLDSVNPANTHFKTSGVRGSLHYYSFDKPGIIEKTWQNPFYEDDQHSAVVMGSPLYRFAVMGTSGEYAPSIKSLFMLYLDGAERFFEKVKGDFYLFIYTKKSHKLEVISSPFNVYPAWFREHDGSVHFSNCIESLIKLGDGLDYDSRGLLEFSMFDHCLGDRTIYKNIKLLEGGGLISWTREGVARRLIYDIAKWYHDNPRSKKESIEEIDYCLKTHINEYTKSVSFYNCALTGGYDSRLHFAYVPESDYDRMQTYSYGKPGSMQLKVPFRVASELGHSHNGIVLGKQFVGSYSKHALDAIIMSGGVSPFMRAMYPYAFSKLSDYSHHSIIGQCDMIRPLSASQPAGAIYNEFNKSIFFDNYTNFTHLAENLIQNSYFLMPALNRTDIEGVYNAIKSEHIDPYKQFNQKTKFWFFLHKESMLKFWHTECHLTDNFSDYFIPFKDLDFIETLTNSEYCGLYKGILEPSNLNRLGAHDLYVDLMMRNKNTLNHIETDRRYKPKWYNHLPAGYLMMWLAKQKQKKYMRSGNDTFEGTIWHDQFVDPFKRIFTGKSAIIGIDRNPYKSEQLYRRNRFISLQVWHSYLSNDLN